MNRLNIFYSKCKSTFTNNSTIFFYFTLLPFMYVFYCCYPCPCCAPCPVFPPVWPISSHNSAESAILMMSFSAGCWVIGCAIDSKRDTNWIQLRVTGCPPSHILMALHLHVSKYMHHDLFGHYCYCIAVFIMLLGAACLLVLEKYEYYLILSYLIWSVARLWMRYRALLLTVRTVPGV